MKNIWNYLISVLDGKKNVHVSILSILLGVIVSIHPTYTYIVKIIPIAYSLPSKITEFIQEVYPKDLQINILGGVASTNVAQPFVFSVSSKTLAKFIDEDNIYPIKDYKLAVIDTEGRAEDFAKYNTPVLLTARSIVYKDNNGVKITDLNTFRNLSINKESINDISTAVAQYIKTFVDKGAYWLVPGIIIFSILGVFSSFWYFSILVYLMARLMQLPGISFKKSLKLSSLIMIPKILINIFTFSHNFIYLAPAAALSFWLILKLRETYAKK